MQRFFGKSLWIKTVAGNLKKYDSFLNRQFELVRAKEVRVDMRTIVVFNGLMVTLQFKCSSLSFICITVSVA